MRDKGTGILRKTVVRGQRTGILRKTGIRDKGTGIRYKIVFGLRRGDFGFIGHGRDGGW